MILSNTRKYSFIVLTISALLVFFNHITEPGFFLDGMIYAGLGKYAALKGRWLIPYLSDTYYSSFYDHIPFMIILEGLFFKIFGISFTAARVFINLFSITSFLSLMYFAKKNTDYFKSVIILLLFLLTLPLLKQSRFPNFDIPLMLVSFLSISFYIEAIESNLNRNWYLCGLFFGVAMLFKGPMAVFIPITIFLHIVYSKKSNLLFKISPWLGLFLGFLVFSIWPMSLYSIGKFQIFVEWFKFTILASVLGGRGVVKNDYFLYVRHLFTFTPIHLILMAIGIYRVKKEKLSSFYQVHLIFFTVTLFLTSLAKFKLSHYIMPLFPSLAIIATIGLSETSRFKISEYVVLLSLVTGLVIFFKPNDPTRVRDYELFEIDKILVEKNLKARNMVNVGEAYPSWQMAAFFAFVDGINVYQDNNMRAHALHIVPERMISQFSTCEYIYELKRYKARAYYCNFSK